MFKVILNSCLAGGRVFQDLCNDLTDAETSSVRLYSLNPIALVIPYPILIFKDFPKPNSISL